MIYSLHCNIVLYVPVFVFPIPFSNKHIIIINFLYKNLNTTNNIVDKLKILGKKRAINLEKKFVIACY